MKQMLILCICSCIADRGLGQIKKMQSQVLTQSSAYASLNKPSQNQTGYSNQHAQMTGAAATSVGFQLLAPGCTGNACQDISIRYEIPGYVFLDRILLAGNLQDKMGQLLDEQQQWQNMSQASDQTKQQMNTLIQHQIDQLQSIEDNLQNGCKPVDFENYPTRINADVRYNDPVSGSMGLMRANGSGDLNVMDLFNGVPFSALDASPVKATMLIYKK
ncbi:MAG: hypothetical protein Q8918_02640 [Bacteroidota bacterium]|nr:hypothetical protein [Bacteroidota bacterium]MDP4248987.1 hypothetical protein [Bacteroidota bacterium]